LIRRFANPEEATPFMIALTEEPWNLPAGLFRSDAIEVIWHLDLPDVEVRAEIWDLAANRQGHENPGFDNVILARASHEFTPAEIHEAYRRAARVSHPRPPDETLLFDALIQLQPLVEARKEELLRLTYWARRCARKASSE
jgi:SpoVK/Ycf46/Vps4 family AAA+-type ATPase